MHKQRGFTLIELLIVMAIISILMGILLPSLSKARDQTKAAVCMSNMRQIGYAADFYAQDHDSRIPRWDGRAHMVYGFHAVSGPEANQR